MDINISRIEGQIFAPTNNTLIYCKKYNYFSQEYMDAKTRIGKLGCPYCNEEEKEFENDAKVIFRPFSEIEVFLPNRTIDEGDSFFYKEADLYTVFLCTAEVHCPSCGKVVKVFSRDRYIEQMQVILDYLKLLEIEISMPRPRDYVEGTGKYGEITVHKELITFFLIDEPFNKYQEEYYECPEDGEDDDYDSYREYTAEEVWKTPDVPSYVLRQTSYLDTEKSTYTAKV